VREDSEHCRTPSTIRAVALRTKARTKRAETAAHLRVREDFEHCRAPSAAGAVARWRGPGSPPARRERPTARAVALGGFR
jgi:hypothetical protein